MWSSSFGPADAAIGWVVFRGGKKKIFFLASSFPAIGRGSAAGISDGEVALKALRNSVN